jgi:hypothetical protein
MGFFGIRLGESGGGSRVKKLKDVVRPRPIKGWWPSNIYYHCSL